MSLIIGFRDKPSRKKIPWETALKQAAIEVREKWAGHRFKDDDIPPSVWSEKYEHLINPPRRYFDSEDHREQFYAWVMCVRGAKKSIGDEE